MEKKPHPIKNLMPQRKNLMPQIKDSWEMKSFSKRKKFQQKKEVSGR
jgi:hypothetical protein